MVSTNQHSATEDNPGVWERAFSDRYDLSAAPLLRGIDGYERALRAHKKAHKYGATRKEKKYVAKLLEKFRD